MVKCRRLGFGFSDVSFELEMRRKRTTNKSWKIVNSNGACISEPPPPHDAAVTTSSDVSQMPWQQRTSKDFK